MDKPKKKAAKKATVKKKRPSKYDKPFYIDTTFDNAMGRMLKAEEAPKEKTTQSKGTNNGK